jgi:hypothetical protein
VPNSKTLPNSIIVLLGCACSVSPGGGAGFEGGANSGADGTDASATADGDETESRGTEGGSGAPLFDVGTSDHDTAGEIAPTCDNIGAFPNTSVGCVFFAHAPNAGASLVNPQGFVGLGISVGNPSDETAHVVIEDMRGPGNSLRLMTEFELAPGESRMTVLNGQDPSGLFPNEIYHDDDVWNEPKGATGTRFVAADRNASPSSSGFASPFGGAASVSVAMTGNGCRSAGRGPERFEAHPAGVAVG